MKFECADSSIIHRDLTHLENGLRRSRRTCKGTKSSSCDMWDHACSETVHKGTDMEKLLKCTLCGKTFASSDTLKMQLSTYRRRKSHICDMFSQTFSVSGKLEKHAHNHTRKQPYKCNICGRVILRIEHIKLHMKTRREAMQVHYLTFVLQNTHRGNACQMRHMW